MSRWSRAIGGLAAGLVLFSAGCDVWGRNGGGQEALPAWLEDLIADLQSGPVANPPASITRYRPQGQVVYHLSARCCDIWSDLYDEEGNLLCHPDGGITGMGDGLCPDFFTDLTDAEVVWSDPRGS